MKRIYIIAGVVLIAMLALALCVQTVAETYPIYEVIVLDRTVDVNITRLRRKVGPYGEHIVTRLGYGYGFEA